MQPNRRFPLVATWRFLSSGSPIVIVVGLNGLAVRNRLRASSFEVHVLRQDVADPIQIERKSERQHRQPPFGQVMCNLSKRGKVVR